MPLSEHEQRILDEIERRLTADDPKFARAHGAVTPRGVAIRRMKRGIAAFALGMILLLSGLFVPELLVVLGLAGFGVMLLSLLVIGKASKDMARVAVRSASSSQSSLFDRWEQRWRKRFENGDEQK
jgi:hypothetical protein